MIKLSKRRRLRKAKHLVHNEGESLSDACHLQGITPRLYCETYLGYWDEEEYKKVERAHFLVCLWKRLEHRYDQAISATERSPDNTSLWQTSSWGDDDSSTPILRADFIDLPAPWGAAAAWIEFVPHEAESCGCGDCVDGCWTGVIELQESGQRLVIGRTPLEMRHQNGDLIWENKWFACSTETRVMKLMVEGALIEMVSGNGGAGTFAFTAEGHTADDFAKGDPPSQPAHAN